jgi:hypothetical protein
VRSRYFTVAAARICVFVCSEQFSRHRESFRIPGCVCSKRGHPWSPLTGKIQIWRALAFTYLRTDNSGQIVR